MDNEVCCCEECGCEGNCSCGAEPVDMAQGCTLDRFLVCPCCNKLGAQKNKERWATSTNKASDAMQVSLFE
jgi:hypothetical protein